MTQTYAYDASLINRLMPRLNQYEATTGRRMPKYMLDALLEREMAGEVEKAKHAATLDQANTFREQELALQREKLDKESRAATVSGISNLATTGAMGYLGYKALTKPATTAALPGATTGTTAAIPESASFAASPAFNPYSTLSIPPATAPTLATNTVPFTTGGTGGAQAALTGGGAAVAPTAQAALSTGGATAGAGEVGSLAAYDAAMAEGAAAGVGSTAGTGAAAGLSLGTAATGAGLGMLGKTAASMLGANQEVSNAAGGSIAGGIIGAATAVGGPVGTVIGGIVGLVGGELFDSVVCSELLRQGRIRKIDRAACVIYRFRFISDDMFAAYLEWAEPHVLAMRQGGWRNKIRLPFAHAFVGYMINIQRGKVPSFLERIVWNHAWRQCERIAERNEAMCGEVA